MLKILRNAIQNFNSKRELLRVLPILNKKAIELKSSSLVELVLSEEWNRFFWMKQVKIEITELGRRVENLKPKVILEIGTAYGGTLFLFAKLASEDATVVSIDLPAGKFGGGYPENRKSFYEGFAGKGQSMNLLRADSHNPTTLVEVTNILKGKKVDFLFIDGDHTYDGVKKDFNMYLHLMASNGIVAIHDIALHGPNSLCKVNLFWDELKQRYLNCDEIIENESQGWAGIGVVNPPFNVLPTESHSHV